MTFNWLSESTARAGSRVAVGLQSANGTRFTLSSVTDTREGQNHARERWVVNV